MSTRSHCPTPRTRRVSTTLALAALVALLPALARAEAAPADVVTPAAPAAAAPTHSSDFGPIRPVAGILLTGTLGTATETVVNPDGSLATGKLGGRVQAFVGAEFGVAANGLKLRLTGGIQTGNLSSAGGTERFTRIPLEATLLYPINDKLRIGGGARYAAHLRFSGPGDNSSANLNATPGGLVVADYRLFEHLLLDARYVYERYESSVNGDQEGSHWGIGMTVMY